MRRLISTSIRSCMYFFLFFGVYSCQQTPASPSPNILSDQGVSESKLTPKLSTTPVKKSRCYQAMIMAMKMTSISDLKEQSEPVDFNRDEIMDCVFLKDHYSMNTPHILFLLYKTKPPVYIDTIKANQLVGGVHCLKKTTNTLCDLSVRLRMIHGETQTSTYKFDGKRYQESGASTLSQPYRKYRKSHRKK